jgi:hypothetical protein
MYCSFDKQARESYMVEMSNALRRWRRDDEEYVEQ